MINDEQIARLAERIARDLAYWFYGVCERKKWSQKGLAYNSLVIAWPEIVKLARAVDNAAMQGEIFSRPSS